MRDVQNQNNYQTLFIDQASNLMPFIGVIVSPFDARTPSPSSPITIFYVDRSGTSASSGTPKSCQFTCRKSGGSGASPPSVLGGGGDDEQDGGTPARRAAGDVPRPVRAGALLQEDADADDAAGGVAAAAGPKKSLGDAPNSKLEKLRRSVRGRLVNAFSQAVVDRAMTSVVETIEAEWGGELTM